MSKEKHTISIPTPVQHDRVGQVFCGDILVCDTDVCGNTAETTEIFAKDIVHCVNTHDELVQQRDDLLKACRMALDVFENDSDINWDLLQDAIEAAEKEGE